jgi:hypothetical protein
MLAIKVFAWAVAACFAVVGGAFVVALTIAVVWSGSGPYGSALAYLGYLAYVVGGAGAAVWVALHPTRLGAAALLVLLLPAVTSFARSTRRSRSLAAEARAAVGAADDDRRRLAAEALLELGRRSGRQPHVTELLGLLRTAPDDEQRERAAVLLGALTYENAPVLDELRALEAETRGDPDREVLHDAVVSSIRQIDPYGTAPPDRDGG